MLRAILFDKDGTFVDFNATWGPAIEQVMREMAAGDEAAYKRLAVANLFDPVSRRLHPASPFIADASADFVRLWAEALRVEPSTAFHQRIDRLLDAAALANVKPIGDPASVFGTLKRAGLVVGIVTNDTESGARAQCEKLGLAEHIDAIIGYDSGHGRKPEPGQILAFGARFGFAPAEMALVGDSRHDLKAARAAGSVPIGVLTGFAEPDDLAAHADHLIESIMELPAWLAARAA